MLKTASTEAATFNALETNSKIISKDINISEVEVKISKILTKSKKFIKAKISDIAKVSSSKIDFFTLMQS